MNADFGEAVRSFEAGTRRTEAISVGVSLIRFSEGGHIEEDIRAMAGSTPAIPCPLYTRQNQPSVGPGRTQGGKQTHVMTACMQDPPNVFTNANTPFWLNPVLQLLKSTHPRTTKM